MKWEVPNKYQVRELRDYAMCSQERMAEEMRVSKRTVERWETGTMKCPPMAYRLMALLAPKLRDTRIGEILAEQAAEDARKFLRADTMPADLP